MSATGFRPTTTTRNWVLAAASVVATFLALGLLAEAFAPAPTGPAGSSFATTPDGAAAWAQLLQRTGHPVLQLRRPLSDATLPPGVTLVVLGAQSLSNDAGAKLTRFVRAGGRLVVAGGNLTSALGPLLQDPPRFTERGSRRTHPTSAQPETAGVTTVRSAGAGAFTTPGSGKPALSTAGRALMVIRNEDSGRIVLLADGAPVENAMLATADNAQLALNLAGPPRRPVVFAEALHGYTEATGLAAIPTRWWIAFAGLMLAAGTWALARGRRLGPPEPPAPDPAPRRSAYVDALATVLLKSRR